MHCLACGKGLRDHITLAQHLKDKHHGCNDADPGGARGTFTLGDLMAQAQAKRAAAAAQPAPEKHQKQYSAFTPGDVRGMREYLKVGSPAQSALLSPRRVQAVRKNCSTAWSAQHSTFQKAPGVVYDVRIRLS